MNLPNITVNNLCSFQTWYGTTIFAAYGPAGVILKLKPVFGGWRLVVTSQCTTRVGYGGNQTEVTKKTVLRYGQIIQATQLSGMTTTAALHWIIYVCSNPRFVGFNKDNRHVLIGTLSTVTAREVMHSVSLLSNMISIITLRTLFIMITYGVMYAYCQVWTLIPV